MSRRDEARARIDEIVNEHGEEGLREMHARGDFAGPAESEAKRRIDQFDRDSDAGRHKKSSRNSVTGNWIAFSALVVAIIALLWAVFD